MSHQTIIPHPAEVIQEHSRHSNHATQGISESEQIKRVSFDSKLQDEADKSQDAAIAEEEQDDELEEVKDVGAAADANRK